MKDWVHRVATWTAAAMLLAATAVADAAPLKLDETHSKIGFTAETLLFDVDGQFGKYSVDVEGDPSKPEAAKVRVSIDVSSIDTQNEKRDDHLRSADFFAAQQHPTINFTSTNIRQTGDKLSIKGNLSIRGKTKAVTLPMKVSKGKNGAGVDTTTYKGKLTIDRNDFGVGTDSVAAKISLEDDVELKLLIVTFQ